MTYTAKNFEHLIGLSGFSDTMLKNHFTLYGGYVANTNTLSDLIQKAEQGTPTYNELKRRFGWEWNGMRLHELYFENMTKNPEPLTSNALHEKMIRDFGSLEAWQKDFKSTGTMRGIGWVVLAYDKEADRLFNVWVTEHDMGNLTTSTMLLVMDVWEHAYMTDYQIKRADYIDAFLAAIDWSVVTKRLA